MKGLGTAARATILGFLPALAAAWVCSQTHHALDRESGLKGSVYHGFYDYGNGWFGLTVIAAFLFLYAIVGIVMPRAGRRRRGR